AGPSDALLPGQLEVAEGYGLRFERYAVAAPPTLADGADGILHNVKRTRVCYDGDAFRHALAAGDPVEKAGAALGLTRPECARPDATPVELAAWNDWRRDV